MLMIQNYREKVCAITKIFNFFCRYSMCVPSQMTDLSWKASSVQSRHCSTRRFWSATGGFMWTAKPLRSSTTVTYPSLRVTNLWRHWHSFHHTTKANLTDNELIWLLKELLYAQQHTGGTGRMQELQGSFVKTGKHKTEFVLKKHRSVKNQIFCMIIPPINTDLPHGLFSCNAQKVNCALHSSTWHLEISNIYKTCQYIGSHLLYSKTIQ